ncbi:SOS response-associated peptidase family protein [Pseudomonas stutzeri]|nr:SOS response-associated peptidase family protein [Stutzerimonas stutzeri]MCF6806638.1 SOS response-associated peptidase family protein [Stutzerimonas stutzeri]
MIDIHDRCPLVLSAKCAAHWMDPERSSEVAENIALEHGLSVEECDWYPVGKAVGNVRNEGPELIHPDDKPIL